MKQPNLLTFARVFCCFQLIVACSHVTTQSTKIEAQAPDKQLTNSGSGMEPNSTTSNHQDSLKLPPNTCRIIGKVVAISPERDKDKNSPCGKAACKALVTVQQVLGYGAAFGDVLTEGQDINIHFTYTLGSTKQTFPQLTTQLPGLQIGSIFEADVKNNKDGAGGGNSVFLVNAYQKK